MPTKVNPIMVLPREKIKEYFNNKSVRNKFTFRVCPEGMFYLIGGELVPEKEMQASFPLELRHSPENPNKQVF